MSRSTLVCSNGYMVRKSELSADMLLKIRYDLLAQPLSSSRNFPPPPPYRTYQEGAEWLRLPRAYGVKELGEPVVDRLPDQPIVGCDFAGQLKPTQIEPQQTLLHHLRKVAPYGLFSLQTGSGKTVVAISVIAALKQRTCILVHKKQLLNQWVSELRTFLPGVSVGIVMQGNKDIVPEKDVYVVMIQTLLRIPSVPSIFGLTIVDECHHIPSQSFSQTMFKVNAKYLIGLSATLERKDGLMSTLQHHLGDVVHREIPDRSNQMQTYVWVRHHQARGMGGGTFNDLLDALCSNKRRTDLIVDSVKQVLKGPSGTRRHVVILTERVNHARELASNFPDAGLMIGGLSEADCKEQMTKKVLVGTFGMLSEGISIARLNTLVLASPKKDIIQSIGRIYRKVHSDVYPLIVDVADSCLRGQLQERLDQYQTELRGNVLISTKPPPATTATSSGKSAPAAQETASD